MIIMYFFDFNLIFTHIIYIGRYIDCLVKYLYNNMLGGPRELSEKVLWLYEMPEMYPSNGIFILMQVVGFERSALYNNRYT